MHETLDQLLSFLSFSSFPLHQVTKTTILTHPSNLITSPSFSSSFSSPIEPKNTEIMMSSTPDSSHVQARKPTVNNTQTSSGNRKTAAGSSTSPKPPDNQQVLKCPRCDSPNTKFCYYNNYSLTQPRHFCKTCRRYWTKGGALRNVPIGGGCRKSKKNKSSTSGFCFSTSSPSNIKQDYSFDTDGSSFKLYHGGFSPSFDQFDQFGRIPFSRLTSSISTNGLFNNNHHQLVSFGDLSSNSTPTANTPPSVNPCFNMEAASLSSGSSLMGFNHLGVGSSSSSVFKQGGDENNTTELFHGGGGGGGGGGGLVHHPHQDMGPMTSHHHNSSNLASTMESLSSINQELHWKLQQERLAMLFGGGDNNNQNQNTTTHNNNIHHHHQNKEISSTSVSSISGDLVLDHQNQQQTQKPLPISFQNLEISKQELQVGGGGGGNPSKKGSEHGNEWLFDQNTYNSSIPTNTATNNSSSWKGIQAWSDHLHNYM